MIAMEHDPRRLREAFGCFPTGVVAMCALVDGEPIGLAVSSFTSVSLDPPLVSVCVRNSSVTWARLRDRPRLGLSVLAEDQAETCRSLAGRHDERFAGLRWQALRDGGVLVDGSIAGFDCSVFATMPAGDHLIAVLRIHGLWFRKTGTPLVFHGSRFRRLEASLTGGAPPVPGEASGRRPGG